MTSPAHLTRMRYVDDSGREPSGLIVYGWVDVAPSSWSGVLRRWLDLRRRLDAEFGIRVTRELHATEYVNGRARISADPPRRYRSASAVLWKDLGRDVALQCLRTLCVMPDLAVGAVYRRTQARGREFSEVKYATYADLVAELDQELAGTGQLGQISMDGEDPHYRAAHRALALDRRHVIEDPFHQDSRSSQWIQMADLVAYSAHLHLNRFAGNTFGWGWYEEYLSPRDPHGLPRDITPRNS